MNHMVYFNDVIITFMGIEHGSCVAVYAGSESSRISSKTSTKTKTHVVRVSN